MANKLQFTVYLSQANAPCRKGDGLVVSVLSYVLDEMAQVQCS